MPKETSPGYQRHEITVPITGAALSGTGALTIINALSLGYRFSIESIRWVTTDTLVGAGGTQAFVVRKGGPSGTALATVTPTVASHATIGANASTDVAATLDDDARIFPDTGTFSVTRTAGGTAITAGTGALIIGIRQREQAKN